MISPSGRIEEFLDAVANDELSVLIERTKAEKREAEGCAKALAKLGIRVGLFEYVEHLRCLLFWIYRKTKARNCSCFQLFRPLTESLVNEGLFDPSLMDAFEPEG
jgi:hypothetical protein